METVIFCDISTVFILQTIPIQSWVTQLLEKDDNLGEVHGLIHCQFIEPTLRLQVQIQLWDR